MRRLAGLLLLAALAACGRKPGPPTPQAVGAELATFPQLLVPISSTTWALMQQEAALGGAGHPTADKYPKPYARAGVLVAGKESSVFLGYTGVFLAPAPVPLQPMSVQQFLRAFAMDGETEMAAVVAPKGSIFFTREHLPDVIGAAREAGATSSDLPYSIVRGAAK